MIDAEHRSGTVESGDVTLSYRAFGTPGTATAILIMHGSNYYDSVDWIGVAAALAGGREVREVRDVVAFDHRGFGRSGWSPSKDYSLDALMADIHAAIAHFAKLANPPRIAHDPARAARALGKTDGGYMLLRDPDYRNTQSQADGAPDELVAIVRKFIV